MKQSAFFYDPTSGRPTQFYAVWPEDDQPPVPEGQALCLCGEVLVHAAAEGDIRDLYRVDPYTGEYRPATPEEIEAARREQRQAELEAEIEEVQMRLNAATAAGLSERAAVHQARLDELQAELAA